MEKRNIVEIILTRTILVFYYEIYDQESKRGIKQEE